MPVNHQKIQKAMIINNVCKFLVLFIVVACSQSDPRYIGKQYLGAKYLESPLGEEKAPDTDPLIRFDAFDCMTFIETALANGDLDRLNKIRYKNGEIDFLTRNHFTELDWLQNNKNIVENVSRKYGKTNIRRVVIDKQNWLKKVHNIDIKIPKQTVEIEYIPYSELVNIDNKNPLIVLFIIDNPNMYNKIGTDLAVIHTGFLLPGNVLRHASRRYGRVMDADFGEYLQSLKKRKYGLGIALLEIK